MNETLEDVNATNKDEAFSAEISEENCLIKYLRGLERQQNRAALANLRRGLGKPPKSVIEMYPYLGQFLSYESKQNYETAVFIVAALFAYYPDALGNAGNLGASLRELSDKEKKNRPPDEKVSKSLEQRFVALLNAEAEDLPDYLRQIIGLLKSKEIAVNWNRLFKDVKNWNNDSRYVQNAWARSFWGNFSSDKNKEQENTGETEQ